MMHLRISILFVIINYFCYSQIQIAAPTDTLKSSFSTLGKLDTMEMNSIYLASSFPIKSFSNRFGFPSIDLLDMNSSIYYPLKKERGRGPEPSRIQRGQKMRNPPKRSRTDCTPPSQRRAQLRRLVP